MTHLGVEHISGKADVFRLRVHNTLCLFIVSTYLTGILVYLISGTTSIALYTSAILGSLSFSAVLYLHHLGKFNFSSILSNGTIFFLIGLLYFSVDASIHIEIQFLLFSLFPLLLTHKNRRLAFSFFFLFVLAFLWTSLFGIQIDANISQYETKVLNTFIYVVLSVFMLVIIAFAHQYDNLRLQELKEREKALEKSNLLKSAFLSNMSHEIRTPMNSMLGFAQLLKQGELTREERAEYVDIVYKNSEQLLGIVNDILDIAKIETGEVNVIKGSLNVNQLLKDLQQLFSKTIDSNKIELEYHSETSEEHVIETDVQKVRQIIANLLNNAIKFTPEGKIQFGYYIHDDKEMVTFYVKDTGIGIDESQHEKIFDRFQQVDQDHEKIASGTGLGLAISKSYAELLGGRLTLESELHKGALFKLSIPYKEILKTEKECTAQIDLRKIDKTCTVLLAEDVLFNRMIVEKQFERLPATLHMVDNGQSAVEFVKAHPEVDIVLMDIKMPILGGKDAMLMIKEIRPQLPVVAFTAFSMNEEKNELLGEGFDGFVSKPVQPSELIQMLDTFLN
ncbi:MAG: ATP-binding protein [Bacteroidota bacterium]